VPLCEIYIRVICKICGYLEALTQWNISVFDSSGFPPSRE
jgi:hypothetical protein